MKMVIINTKAAKKKKRKNFMWHNMERKIWAMTKVKNMFATPFTLGFQREDLARSQPPQRPP